MGLDEFTALLQKGKYFEAKDLADKLVQEGIPETTINCRAYYLVGVLKLTKLKKAKKLVKIFEEYHWDRWLEEGP